MCGELFSLPCDAMYKTLCDTPALCRVIVQAVGNAKLVRPGKHPMYNILPNFVNCLVLSGVSHAPYLAYVCDFYVVKRVVRVTLNSPDD